MLDIREGDMVEGLDGVTMWPYRGRVLSVSLIDAGPDMALELDTGSGGRLTVEADTVCNINGDRVCAFELPHQ